MNKYETLWEVIKFLLSYIPGVKNVMDMLNLKNLAILTGGIIGLIIISLILADKIKTKFKKCKNKKQYIQK